MHGHHMQGPGSGRAATTTEIVRLENEPPTQFLELFTEDSPIKIAHNSHSHAFSGLSSFVDLF